MIFWVLPWTCEQRSGLLSPYQKPSNKKLVGWLHLFFCCPMWRESTLMNNIDGPFFYPLGWPTVTAGSVVITIFAHVVCTFVLPSVPTKQNNFEERIVIATGGTVGLFKWIIDGPFFSLYISLSSPSFDLYCCYFWSTWPSSSHDHKWSEDRVGLVDYFLHGFCPLWRILLSYSAGTPLDYQSFFKGKILSLLLATWWLVEWITEDSHLVILSLFSISEYEIR